MAACPGTKGKSKCNKPLYRCKSCGHVGCEQSQDGQCTNQAFKLGKCNKCGKSGQKETFK